MRRQIPPKWWLSGLAALLIAAGLYAWLRPQPMVESTGPAPLPRPTPVAERQLAVEYYRDVKPLLDSRCVVCHGCYDAPCQLKLDSPEGIRRGASQQRVYDGTRLVAASPSRLFVDAQLTAEWRGKGFFPVLNEGEPRPEANLDGSLLYRTLALKREHPLPTGSLAGSFDFSPNRPEQCPSPAQYDEFSRRFPLWGMPYGLPGLAEDEFRLLERWIAGGSAVAEPAPLAPPLQQALTEWERFFNADDLKSQLTARYLYEHLFLAHLYFDELEPRQFFRLVRSRTPPGQPITPIATRRPFDDPETPRVYYRLQPLYSAVLAKTHLPYALNGARLQRYRELFLRPDYRVEALPSYDPALAANPFATFAALPERSRYRFLLDDADFIIGNFIKGPVCRGQLALNVLEDRFWVMFIDPDQSAIVDSGFLAQQSAHLRLPAEHESNAELLVNWRSYEQLQGEYLAARSEFLQKRFGPGRRVTLDLIWDGGRRNPAAALTVFRHFDSASVVTGLVGTAPKTAWVMDYPLLERIHYLLVAGFDVYGNAGHQLLTRLYMDFLRMEGEYNFLHFLPAAVRDRERDSWYQGVGAKLRDSVYRKVPEYRRETGVVYGSGDPKEELFEQLRQRLAPVLDHRHELAGLALPQPTLSELERLGALRGRAVSWLPEVVFLRLVRKGAPDLPFTLIRDADHSNVAVLLLEQERRRPQRDALTLATGFIGAYPNAFWVVTESELPALVQGLGALDSPAAFRALQRRFAVSRSDPRFWEYSDWMHRAYREREPVLWGLFDYNRYE